MRRRGRRAAARDATINCSNEVLITNDEGCSARKSSSASPPAPPPNRAAQGWQTDASPVRMQLEQSRPTHFAPSHVTKRVLLAQKPMPCSFAAAGHALPSLLPVKSHTTF
jgi:hypothetical protein